MSWDICGHTLHRGGDAKVLNHYDALENAVARMPAHTDLPVILVGQSAGGGAVRRAAELLADKPLGEFLAGIVLLSPSMPLGIRFDTPTLRRLMLQRAWSLLTGNDMAPTESEYQALIEPVADTELPRVISGRRALPGRECRQLAFYPPRLGELKCPVLHLWGGEDQWINPAAQLTLADMIQRRSGVKVDTGIYTSSGHLLLASDYASFVIDRIIRWIEALPQIRS